VPGEATVKIIAGLCEYHGYDDAGCGSCANTDPIKNNEFAKKHGVSPGRVSTFITENFESRSAYIALCRKGAGALADKLKEIRGEVGAKQTFGRNPPGEGRRRGQHRRTKPIPSHDRDNDDRDND
jgi:hypothetical protein